MHKDVIYIDTEDDITAIIGKIKASNEKIVALVPPKRIGVLQSAVNLRLLARITETSNKHLVLVTNNKALIALSAMAMIPVAKNLQSKPEIGEIDPVEVDDGEDIIEGANMPIGELVKTTDNSTDAVVTDVIDTIDIDGSVAKKEFNNPDKKNLSKNVKVPNFISFRRKLFIGIVLAICLIAFLVWAVIYAPSAKIIITAQTSPAPVSLEVKLGGTAATDVTKNIIQTVSKQIKKDVSVTFMATGKKDIGNKAVGIITVKNCDGDSFVILANTEFTASSGEKFVNTAEAVVPKLTGFASACQKTRVGAGAVDVPVVAEKQGEDYNIAATTFSIAGVSGYVYADGTAMTGGTTKIATVVTADDIQKATQALNDLSSDSVKQQLIGQFTNGEIVIKDSFKVDHAAAVSVPAVDAEATTPVKLTSATTYTLTAIAKAELQTFLKDSITKQIKDVKSQRIYDDGINDVEVSHYLSTDQGSTVIVTTIGKIGPNIDQASIKKQSKGKQYGDVQSLISEIEGINSVDVKFSYFWVNTVPNDDNKITVEFRLENA